MIGDPIFAVPDVVSDGYHDFFALVRLAEFPTVRFADLDAGADCVYILPSCVDLPAALSRPGRRCRVVWWCLEPVITFDHAVRDHLLASVLSVVDRIWVSDRYVASTDRRLSFAVLGSDARLGGPLVDPVFDYTMLGTVVNRTIGGVERSLRREVRDALAAAGVREGVGDWERQINSGGRLPGDRDTEWRSAMLRSTRLMLNVDQCGAPVAAPLRFALAAAFQMPLLSGEMIDPFPLELGRHVVAAPIDRLSDTAVALLRGPVDRLRSLRAELHALLCRDWTFRRGVEVAMRDAGWLEPIQVVGSLVSTDEEVEFVRATRNAGRDQMTGDRTEVDSSRQRMWWKSVRHLPQSDFQLVVYRAGTDLAGYGMLSRRDGRLVVSLAVDAERRGRGVGSAIYADLASRTSEPVFAEITATNTASARAAERAGYRVVDSCPGLVTYRSGR